MKPNDIQQMIESQLTNTNAIVEGDDGVHFSAIVISPTFEGKTRIQKQQLVYGTLGNRITDGTIHALTVKTFTPEEWRKHNQEP